MTSQFTLEDFKPLSIVCPVGHYNTRNKRLQSQIPDLCLECHGKDGVLNKFTTILQCKITPSTDPLYNLLFKTYSDTRKVDNLKFIIECNQEHTWETSFEKLLEGRWCPDCLSQEITSVQQLDNLVKVKKGRCLSSWNVKFKPQSEHLFACVKAHLFELTPLQVIYGNWCRICPSGLDYSTKSNVLDENVTGYNPLSVESPDLDVEIVEEDELGLLTIMQADGVTVKYQMKYKNIKDPYHYCLLRCAKGHVFTTTPFLHNPVLWCPDDKCDGCAKSFDLALSNTKSIAELHLYDKWKISTPEQLERYKKSSLYADLKYDITCASGHKFTRSVEDGLGGEWCDECLSVDYDSVEKCKTLAKTFRGSYVSKQIKEKMGGSYNVFVFQCAMKKELTFEVAEIMRGIRCTSHEGCVKLAETELTVKEKKAVAKRMASGKSDEAKMEEIILLNADLSLTMKEIEYAMKKYPTMAARIIYGRAKYNTLFKIQELARQRDGVCLSEKLTGFTIMIKWGCNKKHSDVQFTWESSVDSVANGSWCKICKTERIQKILLEHPDQKIPNKSLGEMAVERYLTKRGIKFTPQYSFPDCKFIGLLVFDVHVDEGKESMIEFDGDQHFEPIEFYGGMREFRLRLERDNRKANYCLEKGYNLIRINNLSRVEEDLDELLAKLTHHVMFVNIPEGCVVSQKSYPRIGHELYTTVAF